VSGRSHDVDELTKTGIQRALELPDAQVADDLAVHEAGSWVHDKLTVVRKYDPAFGGTKWRRTSAPPASRGCDLRRLS
jgi:hypothetical protein